MIIDVHAHAASEDFIRETASKPSYGMPYEVRPDGSYATRGYGEMDRLMWDLDGRLERLERRGIDLQLISPSPRTISDDKHVIGIEIARLMNRETASLVKRGGGRLADMWVIPLSGPSRAAVGVVPRRRNASSSRRAARSVLSRTQARGEPRLSGEHHQAAKSLSLPDLLRHGRSKPGFATLFDRPCWRRSRHVRYRLSL